MTESMSETADEPAEDTSESVADTASKKAGAKNLDERLAYRGVFARLLVRPEIGSIIAAAAIWAFFWAVSTSFGRVSGASTILDVSSTLGIMAVAVSMLMIGGEFDLSSGAATGVYGILTILLVRDVTGDMGGAGLSLWLALPISLLVALAFGWFNGFMVNRTSLPSFIVTLGTYFVFRGGKLGFSKLVVDQIQVGKTDDLEKFADERGGDRGYAFFNRVFADEWDRNDHIWEPRDLIYTVCGLLAIALAAFALYELRFARKEQMNPAGLMGFLAGIAAVIGGIVALHGTDDVAGNYLGGGLIGAGILVGLLGLAIWRYQTLDDRGSLTLDAVTLGRLGLGLAALAGSVAAAAVLDSEDSETVLVMFTEQGIRAILFVLLGVAGAVLLLMASSRAGQSSQTARSAILVLVAGLTAAMAYFIQSESASAKFRTEVFSVMMLLAALIFTWAIATLFHKERRVPHAAADRLGNLAVIASVCLAFIAVIVRMLFTVQAEIDAGISPAKFSVRTLWFILFTIACTYVLGNTKFGSWVFAVGGNKEASRQVGVPAERTKIQLFMLVGFAAWLVGSLLAFRINSLQAGTGNLLEFEYIIAAVVGGTALTGGYGSTLGAAIGAIIMAMSVQGIPFSGWNSDWRWAFLGSILLAAVIGNNYIRSKAEAAR